jgi:hypothetical protein
MSRKSGEAGGEEEEVEDEVGQMKFDTTLLDLYYYASLTKKFRGGKNLYLQMERTCEEHRELYQKRQKERAELIEFDLLEDQFYRKLSILRYEMGRIMTLTLGYKASKLGIDLPDVDNAELWEKHINPATRGYEFALSPRGITTVRRQIRASRFAYWKQWIEIVNPIASTIISIIALLLAALALYLQISSDPIIVVPPVR